MMKRIGYNFFGPVAYSEIFQPVHVHGCSVDLIQFSEIYSNLNAALGMAAVGWIRMYGFAF